MIFRPIINVNVKFCFSYGFVFTIGVPLVLSSVYQIKNVSGEPIGSNVNKIQSGVSKSVFETVNITRLIDWNSWWK
jgi:hypothetical protein